MYNKRRMYYGSLEACCFAIRHNDECFEMVGGIMKKIYIMLTQVGTIVSKSIKLYTKAKYNHASIGVDPQMRIFYSFARRVRYFPVIGGFITEVVNEGMFKYHPNTECAIYALSVEDSVYMKACSLLEKYKREPQKYHYNFLGLFGVMFNKPFNSEYRNTCAEFVAKLLHDSGVYTFHKPFSLVRPDELPGIPKIQLVYEGLMLELNSRQVG